MSAYAMHPPPPLPWPPLTPKISHDPASKPRNRPSSQALLLSCSLNHTPATGGSWGSTSMPCPGLLHQQAQCICRLLWHFTAAGCFALPLPGLLHQEGKCILSQWLCSVSSDPKPLKEERYAVRHDGEEKIGINLSFLSA